MDERKVIMRHSMDSLLTQVHAARTDEIRQSLLEQERQRIADLDAQNALKDLQTIALRVKDMKNAVAALQQEAQVRTSIVKILNETSNIEVLEVYRQILLNLLKVQHLSIPASKI